MQVELNAAIVGVTATLLCGGSGLFVVAGRGFGWFDTRATKSLAAALANAQEHGAKTAERLDKVEGKVSTLMNELTEAKTRVAELSVEVVYLRGEVSSRDRTIERLSETIGSLQNHIALLEARIGNGETVSSLTAECGRLKSRIEELERDLVQAQEHIRALEAQGCSVEGHHAE